MASGSELVGSPDRLLATLEKVPAAVALLRGPDLVYEYANDLYRALVPTMRVGEPFGSVTEQGMKFRAIALRVFGSGETLTPTEVPLENIGEESRTGFFDLILQATRAPGGEVDGVLLLGTEVTRLVEARRRLEQEMERSRSAEQDREKIQAKMLQAQKLESLGVLAGGIAHDFNNLLTVISGNAGLALTRLGPGHPALPLLDDVVKAAQRAADLTRQMLAYSGRGRFQIRPIELADHVREIARLLQSSIPRLVELRLELDEHLPTVQGDAAQLHQVLMNLVINGAEAIGPGAGTLVVKLAAEQLGEAGAGELIGQERLPPGRYLRLSVTDSGAGMDAATRARIFDPFFTTKATGRGLGLAAVLGIVRGHHGALRIATAPGKGASFEVLLPAAGARAAAAGGESAPARGQGTILVIDDERFVRTATCRILASLGYDVLEAEDGQSGLDLFRSRGGAIDAVVLDLTMPRMSGEETLRELRRADPNVRVVVFSGYAQQDVAERLGPLAAGILPKPFTAQQLGAAVREAIDQG